VRWRSATGSAWASGWSPRGWCGRSARSSSTSDLVYQFDLLPEPGHKRPAFINLQQYYVEAWLVERAGELANLDLRWRNKVSAVTPRNEGAEVRIETPDGPYQLTCDWLIACDGARSTVRQALGLEFVGRAFDDRFLIVDVRMKAGFPPERWFWFDPPFHHGQSALLHKQPDDIWRIDFQLGRDADPEDETRRERVEPRLRAMLGADAAFEIDWVSVYTFQCKRMQRFVHDRIVFAGDAAHQVSPFGARGANSGFEDAHNLAWKLASIVSGEAPASLIDSYASSASSPRTTISAIRPGQPTSSAPRARWPAFPQRGAEAGRRARLPAP
jgi:3-(3-hydroxy-phenyl)propionate hydroxylase